MEVTLAEYMLHHGRDLMDEVAANFPKLSDLEKVFFGNAWWDQFLSQLHAELAKRLDTDYETVACIVTKDWLSKLINPLPY